MSKLKNKSTNPLNKYDIPPEEECTGGYANKNFKYVVSGDNGCVYHYPSNDEKIIKLLEKILEKLEEIRMEI